MKDSQKILLGVVVWVAAISGLHFWLNFNWTVLLNERLPENERRLNVGYIPVT